MGRKKNKSVEELLARLQEPPQKAKTRSERIVQMRRIRDMALDWQELCIMMMEPKGSGAAILLYEKNNNEITRLASRGQGATATNVLINGIDPTKLQFSVSETDGPPS